MHGVHSDSMEEKNAIHDSGLAQTGSAIGQPPNVDTEFRAFRAYISFGGP